MTSTPSTQRAEGRPMKDAPQDGTPIVVLRAHTLRYQPYKPKSELARAGIKGRWQEAGEYGGWNNCPAPDGLWFTHEEWLAQKESSTRAASGEASRPQSDAEGGE